VKLFISEIVHTEDSFLLKLYYKFNFATEPHITTIKIKLDNKTMLEPVTFIPNEELPSEPKLACVLKTNIKKIPILASTPTTSKPNFT
ncbi:hypothetical protein, partial [Staphylococcus aureus]|uniref:hypothetical protein n=11 Tax=Bacillales TaxID=1385 RepID=UPI001C655FFD